MRATALSVVFLLILVSIMPRLAMATTMCDQTFTIYGKTAGEHSAIFWDIFVGGECENWHVYAFFVGYERTYQMSLGIDGGGKAWVPSFLEELPTERMDTLVQAGGKFYIDKDIYFMAPEPDTTFRRKWAGIQYEGVKKWYSECPVNCSDYPVFNKAEATLLYEHKTGLYKNYLIKQAIYFPISHYLVIMTDQPALATGMDRMDGMLIYKILPQEEGGER